MKTRLLQAALATACIALSAPAAAQQFDVQGFRPGPSQQTSYFGVQSAQTLASGQWELGLMLHYADDLLVVRGSDDSERLADIVGNQLVTNLMAAVGIGNHLELGVDIPIIVLQDGVEFDGIDEADGEQGGAGIGAVRIVPVINFIDQSRTRDSGVALSLVGDLMLPTGDEADWQGEGAFRAEPQLVFDYAFRGGLRYSVAVGGHFRPQTQLINLQVDDAFTWGAGIDAPLGVTQAFHIVGELEGAVTLGGDARGDVEELPVEGRVGGRYFTESGLMVQAGFGAGLVNGVDAPDWRIFAGLSYASPADTDRDGDGFPNNADGCPNEPEDLDGFRDNDGCPDRDNDGDNILDVDDDCPNDPEDRDDFEDGDGCPEPDNDQDGILDPADQCPNDAEDHDAFEDLDGCIDPDNDGDGILDLDDECPNIPEDFDGWDDTDGCADPDNDRDGRLDVEDACMNDPEDFDGFEDEDGCPEEGAGLVNLTCEAIEIGERVHFDTDSDVIQPRSYDLLNQVAGVMTGATYIHRVRVEGHTDDRGSDDYNLDLSQRRATSVRAYLLSRGITEDRIEGLGFGETTPISDNGTVDGRAENRRVEFRILEQDLQCSD